MSEAIENMDMMSMNLKAREAASQAAEKINRVFDRYNKYVLYKKASDLEKLKQDVVSEVMIAVQREVIAILAHAVANSQNNNQQMYQKQSQEPIEEKTDTKDAINPIVADMASLWGEDEETEE